MSELQNHHEKGLRASSRQPLIVVPIGDDDVRYFTSDEEADASMSQDAIQQALNLAGAWSQLDGEDMLNALDRMRHESQPTPPIESL